ncbi:MAG: HAMP domain-containing histidine kinase [Thermoguttaceae bacterium]|nr:HAMP domain-containing histidine kinase [Thermoguttaceae bacterium]
MTALPVVHHSLRPKIRLGAGILFFLLLLLAVNTIFTVTHFRRVVFDISRRAKELPAAGKLSLSISEMRLMLSGVKGSRQAEQRVKSRLEVNASQEIVRRLELFDFSQQRDFNSYSLLLQKEAEYIASLDHYEALCRARPKSERLNRITGGDETLGELEQIQDIRQRLEVLHPLINDIRWTSDDDIIDQIDAQLSEIQKITEQLPTRLHQQLTGFSDAVRVRYRIVRQIAIAVLIAAIVLIIVFLRLVYIWIFKPLRILLAGSRRVASGDFNYRIRIDSQDEFLELAEALNQMTERFRGIRDDLDEQVHQRTEEIIRTERLASVGFLAAGVAHEINNPLASIAMSAESLPRRLRTVADPSLDPQARRNELTIVEKYVELIKEEAFRCKSITSKLLDFSRMGSGEKTATDLTEVVGSMVEMLKTQPRYRHRNVEIVADGPTIAWVNPQEIKQVVVNLVTNSFDATKDDDTVRVTIVKNRRDTVTLAVEDNGDGMEPETLQKIFEPFYTKKEPGSGTGLGLAIAYRIVTAHNGRITAKSAGLGKGSTFIVELPAA